MRPITHAKCEKHALSNGVLLITHLLTLYTHRHGRICKFRPHIFAYSSINTCTVLRGPNQSHKYHRHKLDKENAKSVSIHANIVLRVCIINCVIFVGVFSVDIRVRRISTTVRYVRSFETA